MKGSWFQDNAMLAASCGWSYAQHRLLLHGIIFYGVAIAMWYIWKFMIITVIAVSLCVNSTHFFSYARAHLFFSKLW